MLANPSSFQSNHNLATRVCSQPVGRLHQHDCTRCCRNTEVLFDQVLAGGDFRQLAYDRSSKLTRKASVPLGLLAVPVGMQLVADDA